jgi:hypothetical protein
MRILFWLAAAMGWLVCVGVLGSVEEGGST